MNRSRFKQILRVIPGTASFLPNDEVHYLAANKDHVTKNFHKHNFL